nr:A24 family peptidase [uncultured Eubacterium sp.]
METVAIKMLIGIISGIGCSLISIFFEKVLLEKRGRVFKTSKKEKNIITILAIVVSCFTVANVNRISEIIYILLMLLACILIYVTDLHHRIIPNEILLLMLVAKLIIGIPALFGVTWVPEFNIISSLIGFVAGFVVFMIPAFIGKSVGAGDIKLAAVMGFCLGINGLLYAIVLMGIGVLIYEFIKGRTSLKNVMYEMIPMGPFMAVAMMVVMLINESVMIDFWKFIMN